MTENKDLKWADLHIHTRRSDGRMLPEMAVDLAMLQRQTSEFPLSVIAVTDHESIRGGVEARDYSLKMGYDLEVIVGAEITTKDGHLIGLYMTEDVASGKSLEWTVQQIHKQDGLVIAPHPMYKWTRSLKMERIMAVMNHTHPGVYFDGFELLNAGVGDFYKSLGWLPFVEDYNANTYEFWLNHQDRLGAGIGNSDSHFYAEGRIVNGYEEDLRESILARRILVVDTDLPDKKNMVEVVLQVVSSMALEPSRRLVRYAERWLDKIEPLAGTVEAQN